jgi:hypothetical protein
MMLIIKSFILLSIFSFLLSPSIVFATSNPKGDKGSELDIGALGPATTATTEFEKNIERSYEQISYQNLTKLAWSYNAYNPTNSMHLNTYLIITECKLYNKFFQNEFEWEKIRKASIEYLNNNRQKVPRYYEYVQPIFLDRYDYSLQGFPIVGAEKNLKSQKNLEFASFQRGLTECGSFDINVAEYPSTGVLSLSSPLNLSFIRVPLNLAQQYIEWRVKQGIAKSDNRQAFIRYRIRIDGYDGIRNYQGLNAFNFRGKLMRLDVFADEEMMLPLYNQVF